jgi:2'-5' RNA ligase
LFVALRPPAATRAALLAAMARIPGARWQDDGQLHCTLRFIGEVDRHQAEDVAAALGGVRHPAMTLRLGSPGVFERKGRVDTLWVGVKPRDAIEPLHLKIDRALHKAGIPPDARAFVPHITIARFARGDADAGRRGPDHRAHRAFVRDRSLRAVRKPARFGRRALRNGVPLSPRSNLIERASRGQDHRGEPIRKGSRPKPTPSLFEIPGGIPRSDPY